MPQYVLEVDTETTTQIIPITEIPDGSYSTPVPNTNPKPIFSELNISVQKFTRVSSLICVTISAAWMAAGPNEMIAWCTDVLLLRHDGLQRHFMA